MAYCWPFSSHNCHTSEISVIFSTEHLVYLSAIHPQWKTSKYGLGGRLTPYLCSLASICHPLVMQRGFVLSYHVRMPAGAFCMTLHFNIQLKTMRNPHVSTSHCYLISYSLICMVVHVERSQLFRHQPVLFILLLFHPQLTWYQMYVYRHNYQNKKEINLCELY